jgi:hypothetical protein
MFERSFGMSLQQFDDYPVFFDKLIDQMSDLEQSIIVFHSRV